MDLATLIGFALGLGSIIFSIVSSSGVSGALSYIDVPSLVIVIGGGIAATVISYSLPQVTSIVSIASKAFVNKNTSTQEIIEKFLEMSNVSKKEGLLALEKYLASEEDQFLKKAVSMVIDGTPKENIRETLTNEVDYLRLRHSQSQGIFETFAAQFPAWGMIGTLIGLVALLKNLDDPSAIGPSMAVAILTTLYGSLLANFVCNPIAKKLEIKSAEETTRQELIIEGAMCLANGVNTQLIEQKLHSFLSNSQKKSLGEQV